MGRLKECQCHKVWEIPFLNSFGQRQSSAGVSEELSTGGCLEAISRGGCGILATRPSAVWLWHPEDSVALRWEEELCPWVFTQHNVVWWWWWGGTPAWRTDRAVTEAISAIKLVCSRETEVITVQISVWSRRQYPPSLLTCQQEAWLKGIWCLLPPSGRDRTDSRTPQCLGQIFLCLLFRKTELEVNIPCEPFTTD